MALSKKKLKDFWKKFWFVVWKDDSLKGWIISIIFLVLLVKFAFFPIISLATGTTSPLVIVESCSMYHRNNLLSNFNYWWGNHTLKYLEKGITKKEFLTFPFLKGFNKGDILFVTGVKPQNVKLGDVIIFKSGISNTPVIHRVINITKENGTYIFSTEGDANNGQLTPNNNPQGINELSIKASQLVGEPRAKILPYLGWIKLIFFENSKPYYERGLCSTQCKEGYIHC